MASVTDPFEQRRDQMFNTLAAEQMARIAPLGTRRRVRRGETLYDQGARDIPFYVVLQGTLEVVRPHDTVEDAITVLGPGQFTGEMNMLTGRRSLVRARAAEDGEVIEVLLCERNPYAVQLSTGEVMHARAIVIASGAQYRKLPLSKVAIFEGAGVYYAASRWRPSSVPARR
jgi:hypothetical protein